MTVSAVRFSALVSLPIKKKLGPQPVVRPVIDSGLSAEPMPRASVLRVAPSWWSWKNDVVTFKPPRLFSFYQPGRGTNFYNSGGTTYLMDRAEELTMRVPKGLLKPGDEVRFDEMMQHFLGLRFTNPKELEKLETYGDNIM